jgi:isoleucyl-tRNA synthetase
MTKAREGFGSVVDSLKKEKLIKSTLELVITTDSKVALELNAVDAEDWFVFSGRHRVHVPGRIIERVG